MCAIRAEVVHASSQFLAPEKEKWTCERCILHLEAKMKRGVSRSSRVARGVKGTSATAQCLRATAVAQRSASTLYASPPPAYDTVHQSIHLRARAAR
jgi:hypothetical protein